MQKRNKAVSSKLRCHGKCHVVVGGQVIHKLHNLPANHICGGTSNETSGASQCGDMDMQTLKYVHMHSHLPDPDSDDEPKIDDYDDYDDLTFGHWCVDSVGPQMP